MPPSLLPHGNPLRRDAGLGVDDPRTTLLRRHLLQQKPFLKQLYLEWYGLLTERMHGLDPVLELGSGGGFLSEVRPGTMKSDFIPIPGLDLSADARQLPFQDHSLGAIVMTNVLHHIPDAARFIAEAVRCLRPNGRVVMIEPWNTPWSRWIYRHLHTEPFDPEAPWSFSSSGPLSGANEALPWIVFQRDRGEFATRFPELDLTDLRVMMPLTYLFSGGISRPLGAPGWAYRACRLFEKVSGLESFGMFALIELRRSTANHPKPPCT